MVDLFQDFVFAALNGAVDEIVTTWVVDDVTQFPTQSYLDKTDFWLAAESDLVHPPTFEIVKLTGVDFATNTLTVSRGEAGTMAVAHDDATLVKGTLTADMLRRTRGVIVVQRVPDYDLEMFGPGDRVYVTGERQLYEFSGTLLPFNTYQFGPLPDAENLGYLYQQAADQSFPVRRSGWRNLVGTWGTAPLTDPRWEAGGQAVPKVADEGVAIAVVPVGCEIMLIGGSIATAESASADVGILFGATGDAQFGYYLRLQSGLLPTLFRVVAGTYTELASIGTIGTDEILASSPSDYWGLELSGDTIRVWYESQANSGAGIAIAATFTETVSLPRGNFIGFVARSADCFTDANLGIGQLYAWEPVGPGTGLAYGTVNDFASTAADNPVSLTLPRMFARPWVNAVGVFGRIANQAVYQSGAVAGQALAVMDVGSAVFDVDISFQMGSSATSDWGFWVLGDTSLQNGWYVRVSQGAYSGTPTASHMELFRYDAGVRSAVLLSLATTLENDGAPHTLRIVSYQNSFEFYLDDVMAAAPDTYLRTFGDDSYEPGTYIGLALMNSDALADTIALKSLSFAEIDPHYSGWVPVPYAGYSYGRPYRAKPVAAQSFDLGNAGAVYLMGPSRWHNLAENPVVDNSGITPPSTPQYPTGTFYVATSDGSIWLTLSPGTWVRAGLTVGSGDPAGIVNPAAYYWDDDGAVLWMYSGSAGWTRIGGGTGGAEGIIFRGFAGASGSLGTNLFDGKDHTNQLIFMNGGVFQALGPTGGVYGVNADEANYVRLANPVVDPGGTTDESNWLPVGDASTDPLTGILTLTSDLVSSVGAVVNIAPVALDNFRVNWRSETDGDGHALTFLPFLPSPIAPGVTGPVFQDWQLGALKSNVGGNGAGISSSNYNGLTINIPDDGNPISIYGHGTTGLSGSTLSTTTGTHDWELQIRQSSPPGWYDLFLWCDNTLAGHFYVFNGIDYGYLMLSSLTNALSQTSHNRITSLTFGYANQWRRVDLDLMPRPWWPLRLVNGWTEYSGDGTSHPVGWYMDSGRAWLRGAVTGGAGAIIDLTGMPGPETGSLQRIPAVSDVGPGALELNFASPLVPNFATTPAVIWLDGLSYRYAQ